MKILLFLFLFFEPHVSSDIPEVKVEKVIAVRHDVSARRESFSLLVRNDTKERILVFEISTCDAKECKTEYLTGRFAPDSASWSDELEEPLGRIVSIKIVRIQTVE